MMSLPRVPNLRKLEASPESLQKEFERLLPEIKSRIEDLDICITRIKSSTADAGDNLLFLEQIYNDLKARLHKNEVVSFEKMDITRKRYMEIEKCLRVGIRELKLRLRRIETDKAKCTTANQNANLEAFRQQLISKIMELTNMYQRIDESYCDKILSENRQKLCHTIQQFGKDIHAFEMEVMTARIMHERIFQHFLLERMPSTFINVTLAEFANGQIDTFNDNCRRVLSNICRSSVTLRRGLIRWNARSIRLREEMVEFEKEIADLDGHLQTWDESIQMIALICYHLREDRKAFERQHGGNNTPNAPGHETAF